VDVSSERYFSTEAREVNIWGNVFACLIPMLLFMEVNLGGRLFLSEILLAVILPWLLVIRGHLLADPLPRRLLLLGLLWLVALIVSDEIRETPFEDWSRGWAKIIFLLIDFTSIYLLLAGRDMRYFMFAAGIALSQILGYFFNPNDYALDYPWKFGYGAAVTALVILAASVYSFTRTGRFISAATMLAMGAVNFYMGFRSLGSICLLGGWMLLIKNSYHSGLSHAVRMALLSGTAIAVTVAAYDFGASQAYFGEVEKTKYQIQSSGEMGVLLGARSEILASAQAVKDSPIIGYGSWAKDPKYAQIMADELAQLGYEVYGVTESDLIPTHSYIMGAWVEAGVGGVLFWLFGLVLIARALMTRYDNKSILIPLIVFEALNFLWNIPFSPFGAEARLYAAYDFSLLMFGLSLSATSAVSRRAA
jgi:hypothetical protein